MYGETRASGRKASWLTMTLGLAGLALAGQASAACMGLTLPGVSNAAPGSGAMLPQMYHPGDASAGSFIKADWRESDPIVGLWEFKLNGTPADWGTQAWHADGTELMFSGGQNPETGDVCQGVWRRVGPNAYTLNHIAMGWVAPGQGFGLRVHMHIKVKLDASGDHFSGTYTLQVFAVSPADPFDETTQVGDSSGTVTATRVQPD